MSRHYNRLIQHLSDLKASKQYYKALGDESYDIVIEKLLGIEFEKLLSLFTLKELFEAGISEADYVYLKEGLQFDKGSQRYHYKQTEDDQKLDALSTALNIFGRLHKSFPKKPEIVIGIFNTVFLRNHQVSQNPQYFRNRWI
jgi:hypothetical protein